LVGALSFGSPAFAQDPESIGSKAPDTEPISARVELIADSLPQDTRAEVEVEVERQLAAMASELGFTVAGSEAAGLIFRVELGQPDHKNPVFVVHAVAFHDGQLLERAEARTCFRCTPAELVTDGLELLPRAVAQAIAARPPPVAEAAPPPELTDAPDHNQAPRAASPGPVTYVGVSLDALGLVGALAGGVLLGRDSNARQVDPLYLTVIDYKRPGAALLGIGLTSIVAGTVLMAIDAWVIRPRHAAKSRASLSHVGVAANGLALTGRF
jgi:hypothetical protein